jgi:hypothetical protein
MLNLYPFVTLIFKSGTSSIGFRLLSSPMLGRGLIVLYRDWDDYNICNIDSGVSTMML